MRFRLTFRASVANSRIPLSYNDRLSGQLASWLEVPLPTPEAAASSEECQAGLFVFSRLQRGLLLAVLGGLALWGFRRYIWPALAARAASMAAPACSSSSDRIELRSP